MEHQFYLVSVFRGSRPEEAAEAEEAVGARSSVLRNLTSPLPESGHLPAQTVKGWRSLEIYIQKEKVTAQTQSHHFQIL